MKDLELRLSGESLVYNLLAVCLYDEPDFERLDGFVRAKLFDSIPISIVSEESQLALGLLQGWQGRQNDGLDCQEYDCIKKDFFYLFQGVGVPTATIWESVYLTHDRTLFAESTLEVRRYYERYGLQIEQKNKQPDDHLGLELQFISHLSKLAVKAINDAKQNEIERILKDRRVFIEQHPLTWVEIWCKTVQENAVSDFYKGIAHLCVHTLRSSLIV